MAWRGENEDREHSARDTQSTHHRPTRRQREPHAPQQRTVCPKQGAPRAHGRRGRLPALAWQVQAGRAVAAGAAKLLLAEAFAVLLQAPALLAVAQLRLVLVEPPHELRVHHEPRAAVVVCVAEAVRERAIITGQDTVRRAHCPHASWCASCCDAGVDDAAALLHCGRPAALAEPHRRDGGEPRAHAREVACVVAAIAQQQLVLAVPALAHLAHHELDGGAISVAAHLARARAAVVELALRMLARERAAIGTWESVVTVCLLHGLCLARRVARLRRPSRLGRQSLILTHSKRTFHA